MDLMSNPPQGEDTLPLDLREDVVFLCWCNKRGCRAYIKKVEQEEEIG